MQSSHFKSTVLGNVLRFFNGKSIKPGGDGAYPVYGSNGLIGRSRKYTHQNGLIIGRVGAYCGSIEYCKTHFWASDNTIVCQPKDILFDIEYIYFLLGGLNLNRYAGGSAQPLLTQTVLRKVPTSIPPLPTQRKIANFLDHKTAQIDELIRAKERKIELLGEYRASLINQAVTKGLDPNVKMKPSGVEFIGKIPKHWEVQKLKYIAKIVPSYVDKLTTPDEIPVKLCNYTDVYYNDYITVDTILAKGSCTQTEYSRSSLVKDYVVITSDSETPDDIGVPAYVKDDLDNVVCGYHLTIIKPIACFGEFIFRFIQSNPTRKYFELNSNGITRFSLKKTSTENLLVPLPPEFEQCEIIKFLKSKTKQIDELRANEEQTIKLLKEYRQSLISQVVTGKIDVRGEV